jgi:hypothetical protein
MEQQQQQQQGVASSRGGSVDGFGDAAVWPVSQLTRAQSDAMALARRTRQVLSSMGIDPGSIVNAKHLLKSGGLTNEKLEYRKVCVCAWVCVGGREEMK